MSLATEETRFAISPNSLLNETKTAGDVFDPAKLNSVETQSKLVMNKDSVSISDSYRSLSLSSESEEELSDQSHRATEVQCESSENDRKIQLIQRFIKLGSELASAVTLNTMLSKEGDFQRVYLKLSSLNLSPEVSHEIYTHFYNISVQKKAKFVELLAGDILCKLNAIEDDYEAYANQLEQEEQLRQLKEAIFENGRQLCFTEHFEDFLQKKSEFLVNSERILANFESNAEARLTMRRFVVRFHLLAQVQHARFLAQKLVKGDNEQPLVEN